MKKNTSVLDSIKTEPDFKTEWSLKDFKIMNRSLVQHFSIRETNTLHNGAIKPTSFAELDAILGLAFTSSSSYAMFSVCNTEAYWYANESYKYICFGMDKDGKCYGILWDKDENEIIIPL